MKINQFELKRKALHILGGIIIILCLLFLPHIEIIFLVLVILGLIFCILSINHKIPILNYFLYNFERESNKRYPGKGLILFVLGALLSLLLFGRSIAIASIIILTFGDSVSHFVGYNFGKTKSFLNKNKNIEGTIAAILVSTAFASLVVSPLFAFAGSLVAMIAELIGVRIGKFQVDDNLLIPLVSGTIIYLLQFI